MLFKGKGENYGIFHVANYKIGKTDLTHFQQLIATFTSGEAYLILINKKIKRVGTSSHLL